MGELWGVFCEYLWGNWLRFNGTALYIPSKLCQDHDFAPCISRLSITVVLTVGCVDILVLLHVKYSCLAFKGVNFNNQSWVMKYILVFSEKISMTVLVFMPVSHILWDAGDWFSIKIQSYQYRKTHRGDKMILQQSYLHDGVSYGGMMISWYWISAHDYSNINQP